MAVDVGGRVALVTGASSGIGEGAAIALAQAGVTVVLAARRADRLEALVKRIEADGGTAHALPCDVTESGVAARIVDDVVAKLGRIDILVNSAGRAAPGTVEDTSAEEWQSVIELNLLATINACRAAIPHMRSQGGGDIINISSTAGRRSSGGFTPYSVTKFGVNALSEALRQEVTGVGIRVCVIEPGATRTEGHDAIADPALRESMRQRLTRDSAMGIDDIGAAILFVVSLPYNVNVQEMLIRPTDDTRALL
jgi:NADP-dependent 3-hydroxy acid dehydrogenase YdfG